MLLRDRFDPRYFDADVLFRYHAGWAGLSHTRASTATLTDRTGTLQEVGPDVPRIDWSHGRPALRLEPQRTNGWTWSEDLSQSVWIKDGLSVTTDAGTAPNGQVTMDKVVEDATTGVHQLRRALSGASDNAKQAISFWVAAAERTWVRIGTNRKDSASVASSFFNLATGEFGTVASNHSLRVIERAGSAYRLECVFDVSSGAETPQFRVGPTTGDTINTYTGDGTSGIYLWGLSFEADQPVASSYIKTTSTTVTRATETVTVPWPHAPQPMTLYVRFVEIGGVLLESDSTIVRIGASPGNRVMLFNNTATGTYALRYVSNGSVVTRSLSVAPVRDDIVEFLIPIDEAGAYLAQSINGSDPTQTTLAGLPIPTAWEPPTLTIGGGGHFDLLDAIVLRGAGWTMDQVRAYLPEW